MLKKDVSVGQTYIVKVSGQLVPVKLDVVHPMGGWFGTNTKTGRQVRIRTAGKLRSKVPADFVDEVAAERALVGVTNLMKALEVTGQLVHVRVGDDK